MINKKIKMLLLIVICLPIFILSGCTKVDKLNYDKIQIGMTFKEVTSILGQPDDKFTELTSDSYLWLSRGNTYEEALELAKRNKEVKYIIVVFTTELINSDQLVLRKSYGDLRDQLNEK